MGLVRSQAVHAGFLNSKFDRENITRSFAHTELLEMDTGKCSKPILLSIFASFDGFRVFLHVVVLPGLPHNCRAP